jgi:hypothetical protein
MAFTKLYLTARTAPYTPATIRGAWDDSAAMITRALETVFPALTGEIASIARAETDASPTWDVGLYRGVSGPLAAQTIAGTVNVIIGALESNVAADFYWHIHIYVTQGDSDTPRGTLLTNYVENTTNEWPTTAAGHGLQSAQTLTNIGAITAGDRLVVELGYIARNNVTTSRTGTLWYGTELQNMPVADLTVGGDETSLAGHVLFSNSITEQVLPLRVSQSILEVSSDEADGVRVSQAVLEVMSLLADADVRVSQIVLEVMSPAAMAGASRSWGFVGSHAGEAFAA